MSEETYEHILLMELRELIDELRADVKYWRNIREDFID